MTTLSKLHQAFSDLVSWCRSGKDEDEAGSDMMFESEDERKKLVAFFAGQWGPAVQQIMLGKFCCPKFFLGIPIWFYPRSVQNGTDGAGDGEDSGFLLRQILKSFKTQ